MDLLPGLTKAQIEFANRYYRIFEDLKGVILTLAGISMMQQGQAATQEQVLFRDGWIRVDQDLGSAARRWSEYIPKPEQSEDYQIVGRNMGRLVEIVSHHESANLTGVLQVTVLDELLQVYTALRELALRYWRLELVAESGHIH